MTAVKVATRISIARAEISVPDNERQILQSYPGYIVQRGDEDLGHVWQDGEPLWCWRTNDGSRYGREPRRADAIAKIVGRA